MVSEDEEVLNQVEKLLNNYKEKIYFADKFMVKRVKENLEVNLDTILSEDIIFDNIVNLNDILINSKTIFVNGTPGKYEEIDYSKGTINMFNSLKNISAKVIIGGGDTVSAVTNLGFENDFYYLSSGGGATLEYVAYGSLKALEWIKENGRCE